MGSIDTDGSGTINYSGILLLNLFNEEILFLIKY